MRSYLYAFLAFIVFTAAWMVHPSTAGSVAPPLASSVVKVLPGKGHGSGVHIGNGYILTAAHVVDGAKSLKIRTSDGKDRDATVLWSSKEYDIAAIRTAEAGIAVSNLDCRTAEAGEVIRASGNPIVLEFVDSYGKVAGKPRLLGPWKSVLITDITTVPGMSGGPTFDANGNVVGITVGVMTLPSGFSASLTGFGAMVPSSTVCGLLGRIA